MLYEFRSKLPMCRSQWDKLIKVRCGLCLLIKSKSIVVTEVNSMSNSRKETHSLEIIFKAELSIKEQKAYIYMYNS